MMKSCLSAGPSLLVCLVVLVTSACGTPEDLNPYCEPTTKREAALEEYLVGDWECEYWSIDYSEFSICSFSPDGLYFGVLIDQCKAPDAGGWARWAVKGSQIELNSGTSASVYDAMISDSTVTLTSPDGESKITLRAQTCTTNCRPTSTPLDE